jgi:hypothetical protein
MNKKSLYISIIKTKGQTPTDIIIEPDALSFYLTGLRELPDGLSQTFFSGFSLIRAFIGPRCKNSVPFGSTRVLKLASFRRRSESTHTYCK